MTKNKLSFNDVPEEYWGGLLQDLVDLTGLEIKRDLNPLTYYLSAAGEEVEVEDVSETP